MSFVFVCWQQIKSKCKYCWVGRSTTHRSDTIFVCYLSLCWLMIASSILCQNWPRQVSGEELWELWRVRVHLGRGRRGRGEWSRVESCLKVSFQKICFCVFTNLFFGFSHVCLCLLSFPKSTTLNWNLIALCAQARRGTWRGLENSRGYFKPSKKNETCP